LPPHPARPRHHRDPLDRPHPARRSPWRAPVQGVPRSGPGHLRSATDAAAQAVAEPWAHRTHSCPQHAGPDHVRPHSWRRRA